MQKSPAARYPTSLRVVFSAPEKFQPAYVANISAGGMFLRTDRRLALGALVSVALELPDGDRPVPVQGKVVHVVAPGKQRPGWSGPGVGIQFIASDDPVRRRVDRYLELLAGTTVALQRPERAHYPRLRAPVYWRPAGLPFFRRRRTSTQDLGGALVCLDETLEEGDRLEIEVFLPDRSSVVCKAEVAWVDRLPAGALARFEVGLRFTVIAPDDRERLSAVLQQA
jgi:uncharacterized protein (TIGR02266 family)